MHPGYCPIAARLEGIAYRVVVVDAQDPLRPTVLPIDPNTKKVTTHPFSLVENADVNVKEIIFDILTV